MQIQKKLSHYRANHLLRIRRVIESRQDNHVIIDGKQCINFCSNDYLQLSTHPDVISAFINGAYQYGLGSGSSAMISGYTQAHFKLEEKFAEFLQRESALLFNSGYHANLSVLTAFADKHSVIIADKSCHASIIDGVILSRAKLYRYAHNNVAHAEELLQRKPNQQALLVTESVFSIQGCIANIKKLSELATQHKAMLIVDDAHGVGILGDQGKGITDDYDIPCLVTPLGKALGSMGAIVSGDKDMIETLLQFARTYRYSTALPPAICHATLTAIDILTNESWRRQTLKHLIRFFIKEARSREFHLFSCDETPIKSIIIGSSQNALAIQQHLMKRGLFVSCIRPPTTPNNLACIRISLNCMHSEEQIIFLLDQLTIAENNDEQYKKCI